MAYSTPSTVRTIDIDRDQSVRLDVLRGRIRVAHGCAWLTEAGSLHDTVLLAGAEWPLAGRPVVVSALAPARVQVVGSDGAASVPIRWWRGLVSALRCELQRLQFGPVGGQPWV